MLNDAVMKLLKALSNQARRFGVMSGVFTQKNPAVKKAEDSNRSATKSWGGHRSEEEGVILPITAVAKTPGMFTMAPMHMRRLATWAVPTREGCKNNDEVVMCEVLPPPSASYALKE